MAQKRSKGESFGVKCRCVGTVPPGTCRGLGIFTSCRLLPAATECFIELHHAQKLVQTDLRERQLCLKEITVGIQCVQLSIHASAIPHVGEPSAILECRNESFLLN